MGYQLKFNIKPPIYPRNPSNFGPIFGIIIGPSFFDRKRLTTEVLKSKLPLIIIVSLKSCIVNRQIRVADSKYGTFDDEFLPLSPLAP